ncbi:hypothetical protein FJR06_06490 [Dolichospermum sp. UHCC 0352]|nr:hypothetical protein [Dolichospermum sp. UHCC 0299]MTJ20993.1 hypothetical protein [Dolichospermum sp. UHCC 0352]MTJ38720.1 hypothetical protein [Dolichospermum sp. UHCC 0406]
MITIVFAVAPFVTVIPGEVGSTVAAETVIVGNAVVASPVVLTADRVPVVETPVVMAGETPDMMGMVIEIPVAVVAVTAGVVVPPIVVVVVPPIVVVGGVEKPLVCEAPVAAPLSTPAVPLLTWAWFGNCQITDSTGLRLRAKRRFLIFNMIMIL